MTAVHHPVTPADLMAEVRGIRELVREHQAVPLETEQQARELPAVQAVFAAFDADPGVGKMLPHNEAMILGACERAGVELGAYDRRIVAWLGNWEPQTCAVITGLIERAHAAGLAGAQ
jgi:hypothetical protein